MNINSKLFPFESLVSPESSEGEHSAAIGKINEWTTLREAELRPVDLVTLQTVSDREGRHYGIRVFFKELPKKILREQKFAAALALEPSTSDTLAGVLSTPERLKVIPNSVEAVSEFNDAQDIGFTSTGVVITQELLTALNQGMCVAIDGGKGSTFLILSEVEVQ